MITLLVLLGVAYFGVGGWLTGLISYHMENKYDLCGACIHYLLLIVWLVLPVTIYADLAYIGVIK